MDPKRTNYTKYSKTNINSVQRKRIIKKLRELAGKKTITFLEYEVLVEYLSTFQTNKFIASSLDRSKSAIDAVFHRLLYKFKAFSKAHLIAKLYELCN